LVNQVFDIWYWISSVYSFDVVFSRRGDIDNKECCIILIVRGLVGNTSFAKIGEDK